jgi:fibrillarin-like pre-rRNA processing protein
LRVAAHRFPGVFIVTENQRDSLATSPFVSAQSVYGERIVREGDTEYRLWTPRRSKLAAAIQNGLNEMPVQPGSRVLYLGASSGTTVSHVSDIVGPEGHVAAVEFSAPVAKSLFQLAQSRMNIDPIIDDARHPLRYAPLVRTPVDVVYQDVAQPDQARILADNMKTFCSYGGWGMMALKARSISSTSDVDDIYRREISTLESAGFDVIERVGLEPFERDHILVLVRMTEAVG